MSKTKFQEDLKTYLKQGNSLAVSVLRLLLATILNKEKEKRYKLSKEKPEFTEGDLVKKSELTDEEIIEAVSFEVKKRKEAIAGYEKGNRVDLVKKEKDELEILQKYLPEQLSEEEIKKIAQETVKKTGVKDMKDMGKVMAEIMPKVKGKADGGLVSKIVKDLLAPK